MKTHPWAVFAGLAVLIMLPRPSAAQWERTSGPAKPSVRALLVRGAKLYAGTGGSAVFVTEDDGGSWKAIDKGIKTPTFTGLPPGQPVTGLAAAGADMFAGTEGGGAFRSRDDGESWQPFNKGFALESFFRELGVTPELWVSCFAVIGTKVFAGQTDFGVFVLSDSDESWEPTGKGMPDDPCVISLAASGNDLFAGTGAGLFQTSDNGKSWRKAGQGLPGNAAVRALAKAFFRPISPSGLILLSQLMFL